MTAPAIARSRRRVYGNPTIEASVVSVVLAPMPAPSSRDSLPHAVAEVDGVVAVFSDDSVGTAAHRVVPSDKFASEAEIGAPL